MSDRFSEKSCKKRDSRLKTRVNQDFAKEKPGRKIVKRKQSNLGAISRVLLSTGQAAGLLHVHVNTIRRWGNNGTLKPYRLGKRSDRRFDLGDVMSLLKRGN